MNARPSSLIASRNPLVQGLSLVVGAVLLVGAVVLGAFLLAIAVAVGLVFALIIMGRIWWITRKLDRAGHGAASSGPGQTEGRVIEVEYTVIDEEADERRD
jgi:membrane protease YdiL (CAAX protease family)